MSLLLHHESFIGNAECYISDFTPAQSNATKNVMIQEKNSFSGCKIALIVQLSCTIAETVVNIALCDVPNNWSNILCTLR